MSDLSTLAKLLNDGKLNQDNFVALALAVQRGSEQYSYHPPQSSALIASCSTGNTSVPCSAPQTLTGEETKRTRSPVVESGLSPPVTQGPPRQTTLFDHGAVVKRKLPDGSQFSVRDRSGLPSSLGRRGDFPCLCCAKYFKNQGALGAHQRWSHTAQTAWGSLANRAHVVASSLSSCLSSPPSPLSTLSSSLTGSDSPPLSPLVPTSSPSPTTVVAEPATALDNQANKKKKATKGADKRTRYSYKQKWVFLSPSGCWRLSD